ncbi:Uncharacterised protein [Dorea longicatena]|nr:Uncharacterised protein [Dorea longicatena]
MPPKIPVILPPTMPLWIMRTKSRPLPTAPAGFCPPSARCGMFIKTALLCLKARQWYQA